MIRLAPVGAKVPKYCRPKWEYQREQALALAAAYSADTLAVAWREAMTREASGHDKMNLGHLK